MTRHAIIEGMCFTWEGDPEVQSRILEGQWGTFHVKDKSEEQEKWYDDQPLHGTFENTSE